MKYDCYKQGISGAFEIDLNDPYETGEETNNVYKAGYKKAMEEVAKKMRKPTIKDRIWGVLMYIPEYVGAVIRNDKNSAALLRIMIELTAKGDYEIDEDVHKR